MTEILCLDTTVYLKWLSPGGEEDTDKAIALVEGATGELIAPALAWAEVGSALRKKVRMGLLNERDCQRAWRAFQGLGIIFLENGTVSQRAWELVEALGLPNSYDASFLAVAELAPDGPCPFWTADGKLLRHLAGSKSYVRRLADHPGKPAI